MDRQAPEDSRSSQPWVWALLVALSLLIVTAGAIVGMVTTDEGDGDGGEAFAPAGSDIGSGPESAALPSAPPPLPPPTVSIPPLTGEPPPDTGFVETGVTEPVPPATVPPATTDGSAGAVGTWPAGQSGYTVILASIPEDEGRARADAAAQQALAAGLSSVGVLRSADYSSLRPGYWVAYAGVYDSLAEARATLAQAQAAGFPTAYTRRVSP
jgi:hypothetical protein